VEGRELDAVPVYLTQVEVGAYLGDFGRGNVVGGAPDAFGGFVLLFTLNVLLQQDEEAKGSEDVHYLSMSPSARG
jgi:hypothetical protein